jgi:hypothetical protein
MSVHELIKALDKAYKDQQIEETKIMFSKWRVAYLMGSQSVHNGKFYCGVISDVAYTPELVLKGEEGTYNLWYGNDLYEAVIKASVAVWTHRHLKGLPTK